MFPALLRLLGFRPAAAAIPETFACETPASVSSPGTGRLVRRPRGAVLMLDIDGVLHPAQSGSLIYLPVLENWLRAHPSVDVVISSNWRDSHSLDQLRAFFSEDLQERVIGTTPNLPDAYREDEIEAWAGAYGITRWIALDDRAQDFPRTAGTHLVTTEYFDGITPVVLAELSMKFALLSGPPLSSFPQPRTRKTAE